MTHKTAHIILAKPWNFTLPRFRRFPALSAVTNANVELALQVAVAFVDDPMLVLVGIVTLVRPMEAELD
jgi:hypothetical protein